MSEFNALPLVSWFPGHMSKATRKIREILKVIDLVVEVCDARLPASSRNPTFDRLFQHKVRFVVFNKADLADPAATGQWKAWYRQRGIRVAAVSASDGTGLSSLAGEWRAAYMANPRPSDAGGPLRHPLRVLIAGVPNVGKSTLINRLVPEHRVAVGPTPGVTRAQQWITMRGDISLLDTPGILWPRIRDKEHELRLAACGCIKEDLIGNDLLADFLRYDLARLGVPVRWDLYGLDACPETIDDLLLAVARRRGMLLPGGLPDIERSAATLIREFREGRLGRFTFEPPEDPLPRDA